MSAEQLIALEAAIAELATLYTVAKGFAALQARAEGELLPAVSRLGRHLRRLLRADQLSEPAVEAAAREIMALGSGWRAALEELHQSAVYQQTLAALAADRQDELATLIPRVVAGLSLVRPAPTLYIPVSPSSGRRLPGSSPFLSAAACAEQLLVLRAEGIAPESVAGEWWDRELVPIGCADTPAGLDSPIALRLDAADVPCALFAVPDEASYSIFTPCLRAPLTIVIAANATDEWWNAYEESYHAFRDVLQRELAARGCSVTVAE